MTAKEELDALKAEVACKNAIIQGQNGMGKKYTDAVNEVARLRELLSQTLFFIDKDGWGDLHNKISEALESEGNDE